MSVSSYSKSESDRERWNRKHHESLLGSRDLVSSAPDALLDEAFAKYVLPQFPNGGTALDLAGGSGRHAIWLAKRGWDVTLIDVSDVGVEQARQNAGPLASNIRFVVDDLTHFRAPQKLSGVQYDLAIVFYYLEREIFPEILSALRPGGLLIYKTHLRPSPSDLPSDASPQTNLTQRPKNPAYLLAPGELLRLVPGMRIMHYREDLASRPTAGLVAEKAF
ncbi:MAG TPA: class I SAM-dependent methyltransferase [Terriglobales bacterium]|nr:class I SAM-dependent methyltransferase [Terriglobales bacterium]